MPRAVRGRDLPEGDPRVFRALADPTRRRILRTLGDGEMRTSDIAARFDVSRPAVSKHLKVLVDAGLVRRRRAGREMRYAIVDGPLRDAAATVGALDAFWRERMGTLGDHLDREARKP